jgi:trimeric autotransporter adhesin
MKTKFYCAFSLIIFFAFNNKSIAQANKALSNLTSPTAVNQSLLPSTAHSKNLGNSTNQWQYLYLYGRIYLNGVLTMHAHGTNNFFAGGTAGNTSVTGANNTGVGVSALQNISGGSSNTAIGYGALATNTTGFSNTATGIIALENNTSGIYNTANGVSSLASNTTGARNSANGAYVLNANKTGNYNTGSGEFAGSDITSGDDNTFIGYNSNGDNNIVFNNSTAIGNASFVNASNIVRIGNNNITSIGGYVNWSNISDGRVKKNIKQNVPGLDFINKLTPITYNLNLDAADKILQKHLLKDENGNTIQPSQFDIESRKVKEQIIYTGFVAQDVENAAKNLHYDFSGVDVAKNEHDLYGLRYADFVVPLVKAVQELSKMNDAKDSAIQQQNIKINDLQNQINELKAMIVPNQSTANSQLSTLSSASLSQNIPNPFSSSTTISYSIPQQFSSAKIIITDKNGNALKQINISNNKGNVTVDAATLSSGVYQYSLYVDGKLIATKQLVVSK